MSTSSIRVLGFLLILSLLFPTLAWAAPATQGETIHVVEWGETLELIAARYGVTVEAVMAANGLTDPDFVYVGQRLIIPASDRSGSGGQHVVAPGETLTSIAIRYGTTLAALASANGLRDTDMIYVGQVLKVPGASSSPSMPSDRGCAAYYTVQWGDTLSGIAWGHQTTVNALRQANDLYSDFIYQGQRLCVPPGGMASRPASAAPEYDYYTVQPGDTLMSIASRFGVSQAALMSANNLANSNLIYVGQRLTIPGLPREAAREAAPRRLSLQPAKIAFPRWNGHNYDLYVANIDGSDQRLFLQRAAGPSWSPEGQRLSIFGEPGIDHQAIDDVTVDFPDISDGVFIVELGRPPHDLGQLRLTQIKQEGSARSTAWAPNGQMIAWDARPGGNYAIYFWGEPGTPFETQSIIEIPGEQPDWSPDSSHLVYRSGRDNKQGLWISDRFGSFSFRITDDGSDSFPRWSPDGRWIVFQREADGNVDIYLMPTPEGPRPEHPGPMAGPPGPSGPTQPSWIGPAGPGQPPTGPDSRGIRRLTDAPGPDTLPAWTPDGRIVFRSARSGNWAIFVMNPDGSQQQPIIPDTDPGPDWGFAHIDVHPLN
jgi:LysM repeat protein